MCWPVQWRFTVEIVVMAINNTTQHGIGSDKLNELAGKIEHELKKNPLKLFCFFCTVWPCEAQHRAFVSGMGNRKSDMLN